MNIPKKLEVPFFEIEKKYPDWMRQIRLSVQQLICNQNELIDYLQAKEEATIIPVGCFCTKKHSTGEASKGEGKLLKLKPEDISGEYDYKVDIKNSLPIPKEEKCNCKK